uniref:Uncharacterized protein n=1 Tax=Tanacetum cinerariifolium TaxID=118510 RepID=A0A6L2JYP1_TANCI|nr:hypothetical protein [Tanacetum cinerariifolium]
MTGNENVFSTYQAYDGGRGIRKNGLYVINIGKSPRDKLCLTTIDENSTLWNRSMEDHGTSSKREESLGSGTLMILGLFCINRMLKHTRVQSHGSGSFFSSTPCVSIESTGGRTDITAVTPNFLSNITLNKSNSTIGGMYGTEVNGSTSISTSIGLNKSTSGLTHVSNVTGSSFGQTGTLHEHYTDSTIVHLADIDMNYMNSIATINYEFASMMETLVGSGAMDASLASRPGTSKIPSMMKVNDIDNAFNVMPSVEVVFRVLLKTSVDIDNFTRDIESGKYEVWSKLTRDQREVVLDTVCSMWEALMDVNDNMTSEMSLSHPAKSGHTGSDVLITSHKIQDFTIQDLHRIYVYTVLI